MVEKRYTDEEKQYHEETVEKTAKKAVEEGSTTEQVGALITEALETLLTHEDLRYRFKRDVFRRLEDLKRTATDEAEKKIVEQFEGVVKTKEGTYMPAGIDKKFKVRVRAGKPWSINELYGDDYKGSRFAKYLRGGLWTVCGLGKRILGETVDARKFDKLVRDIQSVSEEVESLETDYEQMMAARKSCLELIGMAKAGFAAKISARGISSVFGSMRESASEAIDNYWESRPDKKKLIELGKKIARKKKILAEKEALMETTIEKLEDLKEKARDIFDRFYSAELDVLLSRKDTMKESEYKRKLGIFRRKVRRYGQRTNIPGMETYLDEAIGESTGVIDEEAPTTEAEKSKENAIASRWWLDVIGTKISGTDLENFVSTLRTSYKEYLKMILEKSPSMKPHNQILKFFFQGKYKRGIKLKSHRLAKRTLENVFRHLRFVSDYKGNSRKPIREVFDNFANKWKAVTADEFDDVYDRILRDEKPVKEEKYGEPEKEKRAERKERKAERKRKAKEKRLKAKEKAKLAKKKERKAEKADIKEERKIAKEFWVKVTEGEKPSDSAIDEFLTKIKESDVYGDKYRNVFKNEALTDIMRFYFTGKFKDKFIVRSIEMLETANLGNLFKAIENADGVLRNMASDQETEKALVEFARNPHIISLIDLDYESFKNALDKIREDIEDLKIRNKYINFIQQALNLQSNKSLAEKLYDTSFKKEPDMRSMLENSNTRAKLKFFVSGEIRIGGRAIRLVKARKINRNMDELTDLVFNLDTLAEMDDREFNRRVRAYFFEKNKEKSGTNMRDFLNSLTS